MEMKECEKLSKKTEEWNTIYPFIEWLHENGMCIGVWRKIEDIAQARKITIEEAEKWYGYLLENPYPFASGIENLLYKYFEIDPNKLEKERREILKNLAEQNK